MPKTKAAMISAAYDALSKMNKDQLGEHLSRLMEAEEIDPEEDEDEEEAEVKFEKKKHTKEGFDADLKKLIKSEATLSEGFKEKASVIFEAALNAQITEHVQRLEEQYVQELNEEVAAIRSEMVENIDKYLDYVVENWMEENRLAVDNGLRTEISESFMKALHGVFTEHYIEVPESKVDLVDDLAAKVEELEENLNKSVRKSIDLQERVEDLSREKILWEATQDLTQIQAEKLRGLMEGTDFDSEKSFSKKVETIKEAYFNSRTITENVLDDNEMPSENDTSGMSSTMAAYLAALKKQ